MVHAPPFSDSPAAPRRGLLFPETWPPVARAAVLISLACFIAYFPALSAPFVFDDLPGIVRNPAIRQLWPPGDVLFPAQASGTSVVGRPIVNLTLALNYAVGGLDVRGYHLFNLAVHVAAGVLLFAVLRRTLALPMLRWRFDDAAATAVALGAASLWALHPLQTESVACVIQRTELLVGFFYLLTFYAFIRAMEENAASRRWALLAIVACALGMLTREVMVTAPIISLLYDRTFVAGTFAAGWRLRRALYGALVLTWLPLIALMVWSEGRGGVAGFDPGIGPGDYLLTQTRALVLYLKLAAWPDPLVLDYGMGLVRSLAEVAWQAMVVVALFIAVLVALRRRPWLGFLGAWFFIVLAASLSVIPLATQPIAEHRMYLPLAAVVVLFAVGVQAWAGRRAAAIVMASAAFLCGALTFQRSRDYESALRIWADTVAKAPVNARAHYNLANALSAAGRAADAVHPYETALRLEPGYAAAEYNLAGALVQLGRAGEAIAHYEAVLRLEPGSADTHANLAAALIRAGRMPEAVQHYEAAAQRGMLAAEEHRRFGRALAEIGRLDDALARLQEALRLDPKRVETHVLLGMVLSAAGRGPEALRHFTNAVVLQPDDAAARAALGDALAESGRPAEALSHFEAALRLQPGQAAPIHTSLGNALTRLGRAADAIAHYEEALRVNPGDAEARSNLERLRAAAQRRGLLKN